MAQAKRIYAVRNAEGELLAFVNAVHPSQAVGLVIRNSITATVATQQELVDAGREGREILQVSKEVAAEATE
jgi:hypothetical protein